MSNQSAHVYYQSVKFLEKVSFHRLGLGQKVSSGVSSDDGSINALLC